MRDERTDAHMVGAYLTGDASAFAGIYDRYADALHDTAAGMLRNSDDAADVTQDVFLIAAERLGQLRDPDRLRPWLFAILRNEVYRRTKHRARQRPVDFSQPGAPEVTAPADPDAEAGVVSTLELAADLRAAAQGLDARDQLVLELTTRQHLAGADLADALGVSLDQSYVVVHRMRERVERSLGAFLVARTGRRDCPDLQRILGDWDGRFSVLIRKRVARHVDECPTCAETRRRVAVLPLAGLAPAFAAPAALRDDVLAAVGARASQAGNVPTTDRASAIVGGVVGTAASMTGWRDDGFPTVARRGARRPAALLTTAAAALLVLLLVGLVILAWGGGGAPQAGPQQSSPALGPAGTSEVVAAPAPPTTELAPITGPIETAATTTVPGSTTSSTTPATTTTTTSTTLAPSTTPAPVAPAPPTAAAPPDPPPDPIDPVPPGPQPTTPRPVVADPPAPTTTAAPTPPPPPPPDPTTTTVPAPPADQTPPDVRIVRAPQTLTCPWSVAPLVAAVVEDDSAVEAVRLRWGGPGAAGSTGMNASGGGWAGTLGLEPVSGTWSWTVTAVDSAGNTGQAGGTTVVSGC